MNFWRCNRWSDGRTDEDILQEFVNRWNRPYRAEKVSLFIKVPKLIINLDKIKDLK